MSTATKTVERPLSALDVIFARRSVRAYTNQHLDVGTVRALLDAAVQAPTAHHAEPWAFVVIQDRQALKRYSDLAKANVLAQIAHDVGPGAGAEKDQPRSHFLQELRDPAFNVFYDASTLIVICAKGTEPFAFADCWLAAENLMLAASAMGLGSCCIGSATAALNADAIKEELGIPGDVTAIAPIIVGVPRETAMADQRKPPEILSWT